MRPKKKRRAYVFKWGPEVWDAVAAMSGEKIKALTAAAHGRIRLAEAARSGELMIVTIVAVPSIAECDPWAPFEMNGHCFQLHCHQDRERIYTLKFGIPPAPGDDPPLQPCESTNAGAAARPRSATRKRPAQPAPARSSAGRRSPPKQTDKRVAVAMWRAGRLILSASGPAPSVLRSRFEVSLAHMGFALRTHARAACEPVLDHMRRAVRSLQRLRFSLVSSREGLPAPAARLEPRLLGQNIGLHLMLFTLVRDDEEPIDWSANPFGVLAEDDRLFI